MSKVTVVIKHTQTATFDTGDLPIRLVKELLEKHEGSFDGNYGLGDICHDSWTVDSVEVTEANKK